ncbi:MAG: site-specific integrase [Candidatus Methanomethyliaceae archaeon]
MKPRGIFKRGGVYWIRYADPNGKIVRESARTRNLNEAIKFLAKRKAEVAEGKYQDRISIKNYTFSELADQYLKFVEVQRSYQTKKYVVNKLVQVFGSLQLRKFSSMHVEHLQVQMQKEGYEIAYINKVTTVLKHMIKKAVDWNMVEPAVLERVRKASNLKGENKRLRYLTREEVLNLLSAAEPHLRPIIQVALLTGMRKSEILSLKWSDIDLKNGFILLRTSKNYEPRHIPMCETLKAVFRELFVNRRLDTDWVFYNPVDPSQRLKDIKRSFNSACKKAGIVDFHFHDLRHTCASWLVMSGVDLRTVAEILGHKTIRMTLRYSHLSPEHTKAAVSTFDAILSRSTDTKTDTVLSF